jgi:peptide/nickel transport system substrate-binding protein
VSENPSRGKFNFPSWDQIHYTLRRLDERERFLVFILAIFMVIGFFGTLDAINAKVSIEVPAIGGSWKEGIIGSPHFINPLLAVSDADRDLVTLVFSGLMRPDGKGSLTLDLAEKFEISEDGLSYTFTLKEDLEFHDGEPLTTDDIIFTVQLAKNPVLKSPTRANWEGVEVEKIDNRTVRFTLRRPYAPFPENATLGILPKHIWGEISPDQILLSDLNLKPLGAGPYKIETVSTGDNDIITSLSLRSFKKYASGTPHINKMLLRFYPSEVELLNAYSRADTNAVGAISPQNIKKITRNNGRLKTLTLPRVFGVFFNQNEKSLFLEKSVREALTKATDKDRVIKEVLQGYALPIASPIPPGTFGALPAEEITRDLESARSILEADKWERNEETGIYEKIEKGKVVEELRFSLATSNAPDLVRTADILKNNWEELGAKVEVRVFEIADLNQNVIRPRKYDALLFGEVVGRDPDPFAFWHSSQRNDPGLNIALYTNSSVDKILEDARGLISKEKRKEKYEEFQNKVISDTPAIFLYSPYFIYIIPEGLKGFETVHIATTGERFSNVHNWHFETRYVWKIFHP